MSKSLLGPVDSLRIQELVTANLKAAGMDYWYANGMLVLPTFRDPPYALFVQASCEGVPLPDVGAKMDYGTSVIRQGSVEEVDVVSELSRQLIRAFERRRDERSSGSVRVVLDAGAVLPERKTGGASGYDLCAIGQALIQPGGVAMIDTGVRVEMPPGMEAQVRPRSGLAKAGVIGTVGTIDSDYRGPIGVILVNASKTQYQVNAGDRIAQLVFSLVETPELSVVTELSETSRGTGGFGSTGK